MAVVTASLKNPDASAFAGDVTFRHRHTPMVYSPDLIVGRDKKVTVAGGALSVTLEPGNYEVYFEGTDRVAKITVPQGDSTYSLLNIVTGGLTVPPNYVPSGGGGGGGENLADITNTTTALNNLGIHVKQSIAQLKAVASSARNQMAFVNVSGQGLRVALWLAGGTQAEDEVFIRPSDFDSANLGLWQIVI